MITMQREMFTVLCSENADEFKTKFVKSWP